MLPNRLITTSILFLAASVAHAQQGGDAPTAEPASPRPAAAKPVAKPAPKPAPAAKTTEPVKAEPAKAVKAASWPEGAAAVSEIYGSWTLNCSRQDGRTNCMLAQTQGDSKTGRRLFAIELRRPKDGRTDGLILMPFGLSIEPGVSFKLDEAVLGKGAPFTSCSSDGCMVPVSLPTLATDTMRTAQKLVISGQKPENKEPTIITVPLDGFGPAFDRLIAFMS